MAKSIFLLKKDSSGRAGGSLAPGWGTRSKVFGAQGKDLGVCFSCVLTRGVEEGREREERLLPDPGACS